MKTHFSNTEYAKKVAALQQQSMHVCPPAITFSRKKQDKDKEEDKDKYHKIDVPVNPAEPVTWLLKVCVMDDPTGSSSNLLYFAKRMACV